MDVTGGVLGGCCQVTVIASLSPLPTATTLEGHEGSLSTAREENGVIDNTMSACSPHILPVLRHILINNSYNKDLLEKSPLYTDQWHFYW